MGVRLSIEEETPRKALLKIAGVVVLAVVCFAVTVILTLSLLHLSLYGFKEASFYALGDFWLQMLSRPALLWEAYDKWWRVFTAEGSGVFKTPGLLLPILAPVIALFVLGAAYFKSSYSFSLWYVLRYHFAKLEDVRQMGLLNGIMLSLGRFQDYILSVSRPSSVLCFGEAGCGKTSSVAIPSILRSDSACVAAIDNSGALAKYTSGYRAQLGKVFYFNWDLPDDADKGSFYPHWNPLSKGNLPASKEDLDDYLGFIAAYLTGYECTQEKDNYWHWLSYTAFYTFLQFMLCKVSQATGNDYFLQQILEKGRLSKDDKDILLSYYALMPEPFRTGAMEKIKKERLTPDDYFPIGSWDGIPEVWQGKELCLSMAADLILKNYLTTRADKDQNNDCKDWLERLLSEARLFGYDNKAIRGLRQLIYLSKKQREIVFPMLLRSLRIFRNKTVREKTCSSDFCLAQLRGIKNAATKRWEPVTVYCTANTKSARAVSNLFIELMLRLCSGDFRFKGPFPLAVVVDDVGQMLKIKGLPGAVEKGAMRKLYFVLLCNSLHNIESIYSKETLEALVANTNYKIIMAEDNIKLSRQLNKLAIFATKSVQIPLGAKKTRRALKSGHADAAYYYRLAKELLSKRNLSIETRGYQILLAEGFYHRPVLTKNSHFIKDEKFKDKSLVSANYFLAADVAERRNLQDCSFPLLEDVLYDIDIGIDDQTELDQYLDVIYEDVVDKVQQVPDKEAALVDDISSRWQSSQSDAAGEKPNNSEWWLEEESFSHRNPQPENPFEKK